MRQIRHFFKVSPIHSPEFRIHALGTHEWMNPGIIDRPLGTGDYLLMFFHSPVLLKWEQLKQWTTQNNLMIWSPDQGHYYGHPDVRWNHSWMHLDGKAVGKLLQKNSIPLNSPIPLSSAHIFERHVIQLYEEVSENSFPHEKIALNIFANLILSLKRDLDPSLSATPIPEKFLNLKYSLDSQFAQTIRLEQLAKRVHLSVPHFCVEFKKYFGMPAIDYVIQQRLTHATFLLKDRNLKVADVAARVGYDDLYYFSKLYKKHYGHSPRSDKPNSWVVDQR